MLCLHQKQSGARRSIACQLHGADDDGDSDCDSGGGGDDGGGRGGGLVCPWLLSESLSTSD